MDGEKAIILKILQYFTLPIRIKTLVSRVKRLKLKNCSNMSFSICGEGRIILIKNFRSISYRKMYMKITLIQYFIHTKIDIIKKTYNNIGV